MRGIRIIGMCVLVACALAAGTAACAQAAEYGQCVAQTKGSYTERNCQTLSRGKRGTPNHRGQFEWRPGAPPSCIRVAHKHGNYADPACTTPAKRPGAGFYETAPGPGLRSEAFMVTIATPALASDVECEKELITGAIAGPVTELQTIILTGCKTIGAEPLECASKHQRKGTITTPQLETTLIGHGETGPVGREPAPGEVWTELSGTAANKGEIAEFSCGGSGPYRLSGSMSGPTSNVVNIVTTVRVLAYSEGSGEQDIVTEFSPARNTWVGPYASVWEASGVTDFSSALEIKTP
ncbi:MAG TPA: hypothetical protein VK655_10895 [Solirubrobacteraceae bacterium]|jgi:hypothetical protein|nr:hypothetical protein [Solirubrobacteraceae bacterium]